MRFLGCSVALLALTLAAYSQGVPQAAVKDDLDTVLRGWEKAMTDLSNFTCIVKCDSLDKALQTTDTSQGYAMFMKTKDANDGPRAKLVLMNLKTKVETKYICTGTFMYEYVPAQKLIRVHKMPKGQQGQQSFLSFLFGMGAKQAVQRYAMKLGQEDKNYHVLNIFPKLDQDKNDFAQARLALYRGDKLPRQIWYRQPNGTEITFAFSELRIDLPNMSATFFQPEQPKDWRMAWAQPPAAAPQPKVIRPVSK